MQQMAYTASVESVAGQLHHTDSVVPTSVTRSRTLEPIENPHVDSLPFPVHVGRNSKDCGREDALGEQDTESQPIDLGCKGLLTIGTPGDLIV